MAENPLRIIPSNGSKESWISEKKSNRQEATAKFNRLWLINPEQFNPLRNCLETERIARTCALLPELTEKKVADLGCGEGVLSRQLRDRGAKVTAVDVSANALKELQKYDCTRIEGTQDYVPRTKLMDDTYDLVVATDLIAYIHSEEYRLFMSELARIVKANGHVICSTPIDTDSVDALERFIDLTETEFQVEEWKFSYHKYWLHINNFLDAPVRFARAGNNADYRNLKLIERRGFSRTWFRWNSGAYISKLWKIISFVSAPVHTLFKNNRSILLGLEKLCKAISSFAGISHVMWIAKRRPLVEYTPVSEQPEERKGKKQIWE